MSGESAPTRRLRIAVVGASGFVGQALLPGLALRGDVVALTRVAPAASAGPVSWRRCDPFSARETEIALEGVDFAFYLGHAMLPVARLTQARLADLELLLADNFARAAARAGVRQIVHLGGLVPDGEVLPPHLRSRREVEETLAARGVPLTTLRAGLVVGSGGSSFRILLRLVRRLPFMPCPRWTQNRTQPIALEDAVTLLLCVLGDERAHGKRYEIGGPEVMTYREMLLRTAAVLGLRRRCLPVPFMGRRLSRLWVSLVTGTPRALVTTHLESLEHAMVTRERRLQQALGTDGMGFDAAVRNAVAADAGMPVPRVESTRRMLRRERRRLRETSEIRSVQRLPLPQGRDAAWLAREYMTWMPRFVRPLLGVTSEARGRMVFRLRPFGPVLLVLRPVPDRSATDRVLFRIAGGVLAGQHEDQNGRLEFREVLGGSEALAAIHDYTPRLPWWLYDVTQALVHRAAMRGFRRHLARPLHVQPAPSKRPPNPEGA